MKKILLVSAINAGISNASTLHFFSIAQGFFDQNYNVELVLPRPLKKVQFQTNNKIKIHHKFRIKKFNLPNFIIGLLQTPWIIKHVIKNNIPFVYIRYFNCSSLLTLCLRLFTQAKIITEHNGWVCDEIISMGHSSSIGKLARFFQIIDAKLAYKIRVVTPQLKELFIQSGINENKIFCVGNGCNTKEIKPLNREDCLKKLQLNSGRFYLGFIGTIQAWQGLTTAIRALEIIKQENTNVSLIIAGSGPDLKKIKHLVSELNLNDTVIFLGQVDYTAINTVLSSFDIALAPFTKERNTRIGLSPLKIRDYAAAGLPVIASDIPGIKDTPCETNWIITHPPENAHQLATAIFNLMANKEKLNKIRLNSRNFAVNNFDWDIISKKIIENVMDHKEI